VRTGNQRTFRKGPDGLSESVNAEQPDKEVILGYIIKVKWQEKRGWREAKNGGWGLTK